MQETPLPPIELQQRLAHLPGWLADGNTRTRTWHTENWKATMLLAGAIAHLAEVAWHHPEMVLNYASVEVRLHTHSAGGVTAKDFALAAKIDALLDWNPRLEGGVLEGTPDTPAHRYLKP